MTSNADGEFVMVGAVRQFFERLLRSTRSTSTVPAAAALCAIMALAVFADHQDREINRQRQRDDALRALNVIRADLEGRVGSNVQLVKGLVGVIATEPAMEQERFAALVSNLVDGAPELRSVAGAPDLVVRLMYPMAGNESAIGLDYRQNADQKAAALRARDAGVPVIAGPVDLVQGGKAIIGRFPVFTTYGDGDRRFWGLVSAVVDIERIYARAGLRDPRLGLDVAIVGKDGLGAAGEVFFGSPALLRADPVTADVILPAGRWQLAAVPKGGWAPSAPNTFWIYTMFAAAGILVAVPIWMTGRFYGERRAHVGELTRLSHRLQLALDTSRVGVWEVDLVTWELHWDERMNELYGYPDGPGIYPVARWRERLHPDDADRADRDFGAAVETEERYQSEFRIVLPDGRIRTIRSIGAVYREDGRNARVVGVNWDVSADVALNENLRRAHALTEARNRELELAKARIEHASLHDALTGLPNRRFLDQYLARVATEGKGREVVLLHIDLDRFKQINDTLGHAAGDAMLVHAASVMREKLRIGDFLARIGGDEFVLVCLGDDGERLARRLAERLVERMRRPVRYQGHECRFGVSIGIAIAAREGLSRDKILIDADIALYRAKNRGRNRYEFFNEALQAEVIRTKTTADEILVGLERGEFVPFYQPQFDARTRALIGAEALARWRHPTEGVVTPDRFLRVAEDINVLASIDRTILEQSLVQFATWREAGFHVPRVSVNVSLRRLADEALLDAMRALDFAPGSVSFELVESIYLDEGDDTVAANIAELKQLGVEIEIDDFGTGYASIVSLVKLRPHRLKIDRQLVGPVVTSLSQRRLVQSIVEIGKAMDIQIVAEGVETLAHAEVLRDLGCDILQGYAFSGPLPAEAFAARYGAGVLAPDGRPGEAADRAGTLPQAAAREGARDSAAIARQTGMAA